MERKKNLRKALSVLLAVVMVFGYAGLFSALFTVNETAEAATAGNYTISVDGICENDAYASGMEVKVYYKPNNGTGTETYKVIYSRSDNFTWDGTGNDDRWNVTIEGFPTKVEYKVKKRFGVGTLTLYCKIYICGTLVGETNHEWYNSSGWKTWTWTAGNDKYPYANSISAISGDDTVNVPTNGGTTTKSYTRGTVTDQYGVNWYQDATLSMTTTNGCTFSNNKLSVPANSNRANDYTVTINETCGSASNSKIVTIKTFDYIVNFVNYDGTSIKTQTGINYNSSATAPTHPNNKPADATNHYEADGWEGSYQNLTTGAQSKTVTAKYVGSVHTSYLTYAYVNENGHKQYCSYCGYETISSEAHTGGTATCTAAKTCTKCNHTYGSALGHDWQWVTDNEPTCTTTGTKHQKCSRCSATQNWNTSIPALGHNYQFDHTVAPTCTADGYDVYKCSRCDATENRNPVAALGHDWDYANAVFNWSGNGCANATVKCTRDASHTTTVAVTVTSKTTDATCTGAGQTVYTASFTAGGQTYTSKKTQVIDPLGHNESSAWSKDDNQHWKVCTRCGAITTTKANHTYGDWSDNGDGTRTKTCTVCGHAVRENIRYTVRFNANGGAGTMEPQSFTYGTAQNLTTNAFTRDGFNFAGWATTEARADAGTVDYADKKSVNNLSTTSGAVIELYAVWKYDIYFAPNYGDKNDLIANAIAAEWTTNGSVYTKTVNGVTATYDPADSTFTLDGTLADQSGESIFDDFLMLDLPALAGGYTVEYVYISGTSPIEHNTDDNMAISVIYLPGGTDPEYMDVGCLVNSKYRHAEYNASDSGVKFQFRIYRYFALSETSTFDNYKIRVNLTAGGCQELTNRAETQAVGTLPTPTRTHYTFAGWFTLPEGGEQIAVSTVPTAGSVTYYAHWTPQDYTVTMHTNGGVVAGDNPIHYNIESESFTLPTPKRAGYAFLGWTGEELEAPAMEVTIAKGSTGNKTYTASWSMCKVVSASGSQSVILESVASIGASDTVSGKYGTFKKEGSKLYYTMTTMKVDGTDTIDVTLSDGTVTALTVIPSAVIYFDDSMVTAAETDGFFKFSNDSAWSTVTGKSKGEIETLSEDVFGNVDAGSEAQYFGGAARMATVTAANALGNTGGKVNYANTPNVTFTFTGTAFEVISAVDSNAATVSYTVTDESGKSKNYIVDAYSGYKYQNGQWTNSGDAETKYRVPLIRQELEYGTYTVQIGAFYNSYFARSHGSKPSYTFTFDGVRIYDPANSVKDTAQKNAVIYGAYSSVGQADWTEQTLKSAIKEIDSGAKLLVEGSAITGDQYAAVAGACPNNELWLKEGTLTVKLSAGVTKAWLSVACVDGSAKIKVENKPYTVNYGTQYIDLNADGSAKMITVENVGESGILSLRNIRFVAEPETSPVVTPARISLFMRASAADDTFHVLSPFTDEELNEHLEALANAPVEQPTEEPTQPVEPTEPAVEPTQPVVEPTEPAVEPTEPKTDAPTSADDDANGTICGYCGKRHPRTFWGSLVRLIHAVLYFFKTVFGLVK